MTKVLNVVGARPNFVKVAPVHRALINAGKFEPVLIHTGQHYDAKMSDIFQADLGLPEPDYQLSVGSGSHAAQTASVMVKLEPLILQLRPDVVLVYGDVNSTVAAALTAAKLGVWVGHVEAGLRSFDRSMPEEINRVVTDTISDGLFAPSPDAVANLESEGIPEQRVFLIGNVMIDTLEALRAKAAESRVVSDLGLSAGDYILVTLHRPSNVDDPELLGRSIEVVARASELAPVVFPVHPRTRRMYERFMPQYRLEGLPVRLIDPVGYIDFLRLMGDASVVLTDSGGVQEETTILGVPCVTMRTTTERPITIKEGTNRLVGEDPDAAISAIKESLDVKRQPRRIELWDGHAAERLVKVLEKF